VVFPLFEMLIGCELLVPVVTLPKLTLDGLAPIAACMPVPVTTAVDGESGAVLVIETLPITLPGVVGANCTANVVLAPGLSVCGKEMPLTVIPTPEGVTAETVRAALPEFDKLTFCDALLPTLMFPKFTIGGFTVSSG
jgi:hypothetical protein